MFGMDRHGGKTSFTIFSSDSLRYLLTRSYDRAGSCNHCLYAPLKSMFVARREEFRKIERQQVIDEKDRRDVGPVFYPPEDTMMFERVLCDIEIDCLARNGAANAVEDPVSTLRREPTGPGNWP
jgi:hypothetical protein